MISVHILWRAIRSRGKIKVENLQKKICWKKKNSLNESSTGIEADPTWSLARRIERKRRVSKARTGSQGDFSWWENSKKSWRQAVVSRTKEELIFNPLPNPSFRFVSLFSATVSPLFVRLAWKRRIVRDPFGEIGTISHWERSRDERANARSTRFYSEPETFSGRKQFHKCEAPWYATNERYTTPRSVSSH